MNAQRRASLTGGEALSGRIAGTVLKTAREDACLTQAGLAELADAGVTTIQGWETGRRALINVRHAELSRIRRLLQTAGSDPRLLRMLEPALTADMILAEMGTPDPEAHPLALLVPDRTLTELLAWPITGTVPRQLCRTQAQLPVDRALRDELVDQLCRLAEHAPAKTIAGAMLRRQVQYLLTGHERSRKWLAQLSRRDFETTRRLDEWSERWPLARSYAVSAAIAGDGEPLQRFVTEGLASDRGLSANLTYWAYWAGEINTQWASDEEMLEPGQAWSGAKLVVSLADGVVNAPYSELCAHTLWALVRERRELAAQPDLAARMASAIERVLAGEGMVSVDARRRLEQVHYLLRRN